MTYWVRLLLAANIVVYFLQQTLPAVTRFGILIPSAVVTRPWTLVTYMFLHGGILHLLFNMMALYFFGPRVEERLGSDRFVLLYFISGISGALLSLILASNAAVVGASAGVFGVMLAFAYYWPKTPILIYGIFPVEARVLVVLTTILALMSGARGSLGGTADFAHLGGYAGAYLFLRFIERNSAAGRFKQKVAAPPREANSKLARWQQIDTRSVHEVNREEVNRILDKISAKGMNSLTEQERTFLSNFVPRDDGGTKPT